MTLGIAEVNYMYMGVLTCAYTICSKYHQATLHHIDAFRAYTLRTKHVTFKVRGSTSISTLNT